VEWCEVRGCALLEFFFVRFALKLSPAFRDWISKLAPARCSLRAPGQRKLAPICVLA
jgi:hypothetical protein